MNNLVGEGGVRVRAEKCPTCIFRPGNLMSLRPGRVAEMMKEVKESQGCIACHETLGEEEQAVCRGQYDLVKTQPLQIAERLGMIQEV
jgi:hypothetical protein